MTIILITKSTISNPQAQNLGPSKLSAKRRYAAVTPYLAAAARKTRPDPYIDLESIAAKVNELFEKIVKISTFFETPIAFVEAVAEFGTYFGVVKKLSSSVLQKLNIIDQPRELIELISDVKKVASAFLGNNEKLAKNPAELSKRLFSIGQRTFKTLALLQNLGLLPVLVGGIPLVFLGAFCALLSGLVLLVIKVSETYSSKDFSTAKILGLISSRLLAIKKGCTLKDWIMSPATAVLMKSIGGPLGGVTALFGVVKSGYSLHEDLNKKPENQNLSSSIPKFLQSNISLYATATGDKRVKILSAGLELIPTSYNLYAEGYLPTFPVAFTPCS
jgi:hypothetical protein